MTCMNPVLAHVASRIISTSNVLAEELRSCGACFLRQSLEIDGLTANTLTHTQTIPPATQANPIYPMLSSKV